MLVSRTDSKIAMMDKFVDSIKGRISGSEIIKIVNSIFGYDLNVITVLSEGKKDPIAELNSLLTQYQEKVTGAEIRSLINHIFGLNLDAISALDGARISIYSKDQWVIQDAKDFFVIHTGAGDVDVKIHLTSYYTEQTGSKEFPYDLKLSLTNLGFSYDKKISGYCYSNPTGEAIPDDFKGQTIGAIINVIRNSYSNL